MAFTQWRLLITRTPDIPLTGGNGTISELKFFDASGTQIPTTGGTPSASANNSIAGNAFDGDPTTIWFCPGCTPAAPQWIQYTFPSAVDVASISVTNRPETSLLNQSVCWLVLQYNNGGTWTTLYSWIGVNWTVGGQTRVLTAANAQPNPVGIAWRLVETSNYNVPGQSNDACAAAEIQLYDQNNNLLVTDRYSCPTSSISSGEGSAGFGAFDGNVNTYWAGKPPTQWIEYGFADPTTQVSRICITARNDSGTWSQSPKNLTLQKSTDLVNYTDVATYLFNFTGPGQTSCSTPGGPTPYCFIVT